jgi:hypothetical protein
MKDSLLLLVTGCVASVAAWAFWHYLGAEVAGTLTVIMLSLGGAGNTLFRGKRRGRRDK